LTQLEHIEAIEKHLWGAADTLRANSNYNNEDFGADSLLGRASDREVVLTRTLREKLVELIPDLPDEAYADAVRQITTTVAFQTHMATNREKHNLIRDGVQVMFRNDKGKRVRERLRVFDYAEPNNNDPISADIRLRFAQIRQSRTSYVCKTLSDINMLGDEV